MDDEEFRRHIPQFSFLVLALLSVLIIVTGSTIVATRAFYGNRFGCLQIGSHIIDLNRHRDILLPQVRDSPVYDQLHPSPDGTYIAHVKYVSGRSGYYLSLSNTDGHNERPVTENKELNAFLGWSADSRYFATNSPENGVQKADIWSATDLQVVMHLDVGGVYWSPLGHQFSYAIEGELRIVNPENKATSTYQLPLPSSYSYTEWSPDMKYIAVTNEDFSQDPHGKYIHTVVNLETRQYFQQASAVVEGRSYLWFDGFWMKDSSAYLFVKVRQAPDSVQTDLIALHPVTGSLNTLVPNIYNFHAPDLDSLYVAYAFIDSGKWSVETLDLETGKRASILAQADTLLTVPIWSPTGRWIAVVGAEGNSANAPSRIHVVVAHPDGTQAQDISDMSRHWALLAWIGKTHWFAYATDLEFGVRLTLVDPESGKSFPVLDQLSHNTFDGGWDVFFSPDGKKAIIGFGDTDSGYESVHLVSLDSPWSTQLSRQHISRPVWSPDSAATAFTSLNSKALTLLDSCDLKR